MRTTAWFYFLAFMALAPVLHAQSAINLEAKTRGSASPLPLRNLLIEVRQVSLNDANDSNVRWRGEVTQRPDATGAQWEVQGKARQSNSSVNSQQQVLVLNGRPASIALRNSVPLRLVQTLFHNGVMTLVPSVVILEAGTGFNAVPRWDGQGSVELAVSSAQSQGRYSTQTASTSTLVMVNLGDWVTVAQSEQQSMGMSEGSPGAMDSRQSAGMKVQVRVTAP